MRKAGTLSKGLGLKLAAAILAVVLLGSWAVIANRTSDPAATEELPPLHLEDLRLDKPLDVPSFWEEEGFIAVREDTRTVSKQDYAAQQWVYWTQRQRHWHLIPYRPDADYPAAMDSMMSRLSAQGLTLQRRSDEDGRGVSFFEEIPGAAGQRMELEVWRFTHQTPDVYTRDYDGPRLAVVIDDWGYRSAAMEPLFNYPFPLTFAVLPHLPKTAVSAEQGKKFGHEIILHQPMEAVNPELDPGPGTISVDMTAQAIEAQLQSSLDQLTGVVGINNHMGSKVTEDPRTMEVVLNYLQDKNMYFLDSMTSQRSVAPEVAERMGIPYTVNRLFLDNVNEVEAVKEQIREALRRAQDGNTMVAIGHVRPPTAEALWAMIPEIAAAGVEMTPVSEVLTHPVRGNE